MVKQDRVAFFNDAALTKGNFRADLYNKQHPEAAFKRSFKTQPQSAFLAVSFSITLLP